MLPPVNLPTFTSSHKDWIRYRDLYVPLVHNKDNLPNIQKSQYLKSTLIGDAAKIVEALPLTESNYEVAWKVRENEIYYRKSPKIFYKYFRDQQTPYFFSCR